MLAELIGFFFSSFATTLCLILFYSSYKNLPQTSKQQQQQQQNRPGINKPSKQSIRRFARIVSFSLIKRNSDVISSDLKTLIL